MEAGEVSQRNFYGGGRGGSDEPLHALPRVAGFGPWRGDAVHPGHNSRLTVKVCCEQFEPSCAGCMCGGMLQSFNLSDNPELQKTPMYLAFEAKVDPPTAQLSLMIDPGSGIWQYSNSTVGMQCGRTLGSACGEHKADEWHMRSYQATLLQSGTARFALALEVNATATISGIAVAPIGTKWHSLPLKSDDQPTGSPRHY
jgi:hypothetical protein